MQSQFMATKCICPLWEATDRDRPKLAGTGTLLDFGTARFLITAAHVIDHDNTSVIQPYFFDGSKLAELPTGFVHTPMPASGSREDDRIDISFLRLDDTTANLLAQTFFFLPFSCIDAKDKISPSRHYMFSGYPTSRSRLSSPRDHKMKATAHSFTSHTLSTHAIQESGFDPEMHIVVDFKRNEMMNEDGKIVTAPDPDGISGGAVWYGDGVLSKWPTGESLHLVGIGIANPTRPSALVGTRIHFVLEGIRAKYPDLSEFLPRRNGIPINVSVI